MKYCVAWQWWDQTSPQHRVLPNRETADRLAEEIEEARTVYGGELLIRPAVAIHYE